MTTAIYTGVLHHESCIKCGVHFGLDSQHQKTLREHKGTTFYCPNGHPMIYTGETQVERAQREARVERERREMAEQSLAHARDRMGRLERSRSAVRGQLTRTKRRIANGVCPCCKRSFTALAQHMQTQHPDYKTTSEVAED